MLIPKQTRHGMALVDSAPFEMQDRIQRGCNCGCGWAGDPYLVLRAVPPKHGTGWAVLQVDPGDKPIIVYRSDRYQPLDPNTVDHRIISWLHEARRNREDIVATIRRADDHDEKVEREKQRSEIDMTIELSKFVGRHLRKEGKV